MHYFAFITTFIAIANWAQIFFFGAKLLFPSSKKTKLKDKKILEFIKNKTGLKLKHIIVMESNRMYGGMSGVPGRPLMMLSTALLKNLNKQELEYVLLHEAAHFKFFHPIISAAAQITLISLGIFLIPLTTLLGSVVLGLALGTTFIFLIARNTEKAAENFAAKNIDDAAAMITAVEKFEASWQKSAYKFLKPLSWNISYDEKKKIARKYSH